VLRLTSAAAVWLALATAPHAFADGSAELEAEMRACGFSAAQLATVEAGGLVTRLVPQSGDNVAFVVGVARLAGPATAFVDEIRRLGQPDSQPLAGRTLQAGRFATPPTLVDVQPLRFEGQDLRDLSRCRVGDCDLQLSRRTMDLAKEIDWRAPAGEVQAAQLLKSALFETAAAYLREGPAVMAVYDDDVHPVDVASGFARILEARPSVLSSNPPLYEYLLHPSSVATPPGVEDFVFWSKVRLQKPVISIVHVLLQRREGPDGAAFDVVLKHVYDSPSFLAYAEFLTLLPLPGSHDGFYLLRSVRALVNPPHGLLRGTLLGRIKRGMRDQLSEDLSRRRRPAAGP
jgi:hypothetical protein